MIKKLRAQSCRRRSARLDPDHRKTILASHHQSPEEKVQRYYELLQEKKAMEENHATNCALVSVTNNK